jgi:hypothetical protein
MTQTTTLEPQVFTCADCPYFQPHNDGTNNGWCNLFDHFAKLAHKQTTDCVNTIRDEEAVTQNELEQQPQELAPEFEIDSEKDADFGELFRLWKGWQFAGSFYKALDGKWVIQPVKAEIRGRFSTDTQAILVLIAIFENPELQTE